jgi:hypothetical protein
MPLTALGGSTGTVTVGDVSLGLFPQPLHPNVMEYVAAVTANGYSPARDRVDALNNLVWSLVGTGLWDKCQAIYPFLGGTTINTHKWNIKDVRDADAAFRLNATVVSGFTYSENGVQSNTTLNSQGQFLNSYYIPFSKTSLTTPQSPTITSAHLSAYINIAPTINSSTMVGALSGGGNATFQLGRISAGTFYFGAANATNANYMQSAPIATGFYSPVRTAANTSALYKNGVNTNSPTGTTAPTAAPTGVTYLFNRTAGGAASNGRLAFVSFGDGLTAQESLDFYNIVQTYQIALGRQV